MLKIGTVNFHRAHNYGALLVSYSLKKWCEKQGAYVRCVGYYPEYRTDYYPAKRPNIETFINEFLLPEGNLDCVYDLVIYGSDIIWRAFKNYGFDKVYFGSDAICGKRKMTFSACMAMSHLGDESDALFKQYLSNFDAVSVREDCGRDYLQPFTNSPVFHTCDPTFLLGSDEWAKLSAPRLIDGEYGIIYNQQYSLAIYDIAETFADKINIPVYILNNRDGALREQCGRIINKDLGPKEFLSLIKHSKYVFAASFHGVVFSIIFRKQFFTMAKLWGERIDSLLRTLDLENRRVWHSSGIDVKNEIDYSIVRRKLDAFVSVSEEYLRANLK